MAPDAPRTPAGEVGRAPAATVPTFITHDPTSLPYRHPRPRGGRGHRRRRVLGTGPPARDAHIAVGPAPLDLPHHRRRGDAPPRRGTARRCDPDPPAARDLGEPAHVGGLGRFAPPDAARHHPRPPRLRALRPHLRRRLLGGADVAIPPRRARHPRRATGDRRRQLTRRRAGLGLRGRRHGARGGADPRRCGRLSVAGDVGADRIPPRADAGRAAPRLAPAPARRHREQPPQRLRGSVACDARARGPLLRDGGP